MTLSQPGQPGFIRLAGLSKAYQEGDRRRVVLENASAEFGRGEFVALVGRSGSGKSTLLNLVSGIDRPDAGQIWLAGRELTELRYGNHIYRLPPTGSDARLPATA